jgi:cytoplasmic iron level regulating protein YaaA (DUF328/UPF0246 family)
MIILLHSSKAMRTPAPTQQYRSPQLLAKAIELDAYLKTLSVATLARVMELSKPLAQKTHQLIADWQANGRQSLAIDSFMGDIYSGLQAHELSDSDRDYADKVLYILSGLYGVLRPYDGIRPYRCEMGYRFADARYANLPKFWGESVADCLPSDELIVNLAAIEYSKVVTPFIDKQHIVTPRFLTVSPKTKQPVMVVVHTKIARGAFARWLIQSRTTDRNKLQAFRELGYRYDPGLSEPGQPAFVCEKFGGIGLSTRLLNDLSP